MLNTEDFVKRLELIFEYYGLSGSSFADKIGIQRSSLSHLLSGRNKPSLEFVMKIVSILPEVEFNWILNGIGVFPNNLISEKQKEISLEQINPILPFPDEITNTIVKSLKNDTENKIEQSSNFELENESKRLKLKIIIQIVIFYDDGTFSNYKSN